jgi:antitoxin PrlF
MAHFESKMSSKGQLTVPVAVRKQFDLKTGDIVDFYIEEGERAVRIVPRNKSILELAGMLGAHRPATGRAVTIEEMNEAVGQYLADKHDRISREWNEWHEFQEWKRLRNKRPAE